MTADVASWQKGKRDNPVFLCVVFPYLSSLTFLAPFLRSVDVFISSKLCRIKVGGALKPIEIVGR